MTFRVGMKVVCVDASDCSDILRHNGIYTISKVGLLSHGESGVTVEEDKSDCGWPIHWRASRFRPLVDTKQEVSFTTGAPIDSERWDGRRRRVVEPMPVDGWRVGV